MSIQQTFHWPQPRDSFLLNENSLSKFWFKIIFWLTGPNQELFRNGASEKFAKHINTHPMYQKAGYISQY